MKPSETIILTVKGNELQYVTVPKELAHLNFMLADFGKPEHYSLYQVEEDEGGISFAIQELNKQPNT